jgi:hypothetical protein
MSVIELVAVILLAVAARGVYVYLRPYKECRWCRGRRTGRRCWRCKGTKLTRRIGARRLHQVRLSAGRDDRR